MTASHELAPGGKIGGVGGAVAMVVCVRFVVSVSLSITLCELAKIGARPLTAHAHTPSVGAAEIDMLASLLALTATGAPVAVEDYSFARYVARYNKSYDAVEYTNREAIFTAALAFIQYCILRFFR